VPLVSHTTFKKPFSLPGNNNSQNFKEVRLESLKAPVKSAKEVMNTFDAIDSARDGTATRVSYAGSIIF
jgi:hypothetical protein